ncbi:CPBP family intramembrane glutamic endopeptidase [Haloarcula sp. 1CSR25-25]|uniref:CPBP family intramembrane glutamic endopeptidase n=1 Tax=Haloarcula sp. 1CSR25-25 TaxID=2862545 RepID=UPI0028961F03|nr:CPBP family intramembrane glutamic endopeptidase [Haloarcula sp. 1CSR25-25]MDT3437239.1 CPBP family intramembrane metalloprotease [Haloarcula sp. 1CSR25-25]
MAVIEPQSPTKRDSPVALGVFVAVTLLLSWTLSFVLITDTVPVYTTLLLMLTPATVALGIRRVQGHSVLRTIGSSLRGSTVRSLLFAVVYPLGFIGVAALLALTTGLGTYQAGPENIIVTAVRQGGVLLLVLFLFQSLIRMYGEEFGWRGYLLPELTARWGRVGATAAVGVVWALFHSAFLYRAGVAIGVENPLLITVVQAGAVFTISFPFSYAYYLADESVFPVMLLHLIWNVLNPWVLGDIYGNVDGLVAGQIFVVNGEGLVGVVLGLVGVGVFIILFRRGTLSSG